MCSPVDWSYRVAKTTRAFALIRSSWKLVATGLQLSDLPPQGECLELKHLEPLAILPVSESNQQIVHELGKASLGSDAGFGIDDETAGSQDDWPRIVPTRHPCHARRDCSTKNPESRVCPLPSRSVKRKDNQRQTDDGYAVQSLQDILKSMGTLRRNRLKLAQSDAQFDKLTTPTSYQRHVLNLLGVNL